MHNNMMKPSQTKYMIDTLHQQSNVNKYFLIHVYCINIGYVTKRAFEK